MLSRRGVLAAAASLLLPRPALAGETVRLGVLPFGTASWEAAVIKARGLDTANGFTLETVKLAGTDAARIAFQGGQLDAVIGDLIWAAKLRNEGRGVKFVPYSSTEGALMVPADSPIKGLADLAGKRLGVAGGALDKNWILLRAQAREAGRLDLESAARIAYGAPPLLTQKLEVGELDAALLYWTNCARLEAKGFRKLVSADDIMRAFGAKGSVTLIGYLFSAEALRQPEAVQGFARASAAAKEALATDPSAWDVVRPLMAAEDEPTFEALKRNFLAGIPRRPLGVERADGETIYAALAKLGGERLVGTGTSLPPDLYLDAGRNG
ncbi:ABC transporter substrate-binding protein [Methylobacterium sp. sgz302541]|uniref:ABC transporter substrate-binding protein n=1 Tax=unclassified Methylobacterium TaxID=2615210 RepID=UPI003D33A07D